MMVNAGADEVKRILSNPQRMLQWIPEITTVDQGDNGFIVKRNGAALNQSELIQVETSDNEITYISTEGRLEYRLAFSLRTENEQTVIQEDLYLPDDADRHLPVTLLAPIAKHAFHTNLINLAAVVEMLTSEKG